MSNGTGATAKATVNKYAGIDIIALVIGATLAISFVGFLAWKVEAPPLDVIVAICAILMVYALYDDVPGRKQNGFNGR